MLEFLKKCPASKVDVELRSLLNSCRKELTIERPERIARDDQAQSHLRQLSSVTEEERQWSEESRRGLSRL